jgi:hypothetical protein
LALRPAKQSRLLPTTWEGPGTAHGCRPGVVGEKIQPLTFADCSWRCCPNDRKRPMPNAVRNRPQRTPQTSPVNPLLLQAASVLSF